MTALPALAESEIARFGAATTETQRIMGDHFGLVEGAWFLSPRVTEALAWLETKRQRRWEKLLGADRLRFPGSTNEAERLLAGRQARWPAELGRHLRCQP